MPGNEEQNAGNQVHDRQELDEIQYSTPRGGALAPNAAKMSLCRVQFRPGKKRSAVNGHFRPAD